MYGDGATISHPTGPQVADRETALRYMGYLGYQICGLPKWQSTQRKCVYSHVRYAPMKCRDVRGENVGLAGVCRHKS